MGVSGGMDPIIFTTASGARWSCIRVDHDHREGRSMVACAACWPEEAAARQDDGNR